MQLARSQQLFGLDGSAADDYVQEVYLRLVAHDRRVMKRTHFANDGQLKEFLRRILSNVVSDDARRQRRRGGESGLGLLSELDPGLASEICERRTPESIYCARQTLRHFQRDCQRVAAQTRNPRRSCQIYRQTLLARRGASEVGGEVGLSANAIHATVHRARRELRRRFGLVVARVDS
jgi:DNA-directed RNA polymerase specialized sigma24 family protein